MFVFWYFIFGSPIYFANKMAKADLQPAGLDWRLQRPVLEVPLGHLLCYFLSLRIESRSSRSSLALVIP